MRTMCAILAVIWMGGCGELTQPDASDWVTIREWQGSGALTTERFTVAGGEWRIEWTTIDTSPSGVEGELYIWVYGPDGSTVAIVSETGEQTNSLIMPGAPGAHTLGITSGSLTWTVRLQYPN